MRVGNYARAEAVLDAAVKAEPTPAAYGLLGYARENQNKFATAEKRLSGVDAAGPRLSLRPGSTRHRADQAEARHREGVAVLRPIETALQRHPEALFHLCLAYLETG